MVNDSFLRMYQMGAYGFRLSGPPRGADAGITGVGAPPIMEVAVNDSRTRGNWGPGQLRCRLDWKWERHS